MKNYEVIITKVVSATIVVEAENEDNAAEIVTELMDSTDINFTTNDAFMSINPVDEKGIYVC